MVNGDEQHPANAHQCKNKRDDVNNAVSDPFNAVRVWIPVRCDFAGYHIPANGEADKSNRSPEQRDPQTKEPAKKDITNLGADQLQIAGMINGNGYSVYVLFGCERVA